MLRTILALLAALALVGAACGDDDEGATGTTTSTTTDTTEADPTTTTDPEGTDGWARCDNPEGFSISYPDDWETNDGSVVEECSQFDPEPFDVPEATDERVAVITAYVDPVAFTDAAAPGPDAGETDRATTAVDGQQAVRLEGPAGELYGEGITSVRYLVDIGAPEDEARTLVVDAVERADGDFTRAVEVLDRMVRTIDLDGADGTADGQEVIARYGGGGTPFAAGAEVRGGDHCVIVPLEGDSRTECFAVGGADDVRFADLSGELLPVLAGTTGTAVFRIDAETPDGTISFLPVAITDGGPRGFALPTDPDEVTLLRWSALDGTDLGAREFDEESGVEAIGEFQQPPVATDTFPGSGAPSYLGDVRVAAHDGFDRVVFDFSDAGDDLSWEVSARDEVVATSGETVPLDGTAILRVTMTPASGVDLTGSEPDVRYDGPDRIDPSATTVVQELALVDDFENVLTWGLGVEDGARVAVAELDDPRRLVVDVAPPA